jgi:glucose/mannose-6-phosphate isomerase
LEISDIEKIDKNGMYKIYDDWPKMARESYEANHEQIKCNNISHIVFTGMGGSGAIGDIFESILSKTKIHVTLVKGYHLPSTVNSETLIVATSISGNTEETLSVLELATNTNAKIVAFSSGGKMKDFCLKNNLEFRQIQMKHSPRVSFPIFLYSMLKILESVLPIKKEDILESIAELEKTKERIKSENLSEKNIALNLAKTITGIPLIYYPWGLQAVAVRFKNSLQENAKCHVISEDMIESCHNGIVSWEKSSNVQPILIEGDDDYFKTKERWEILKYFFKKNSIEWKEVKSVKGDILSKIINLIYILDYTSIYLAILSEVDPSPVNAIDFVKKHM